MLSLVTGNTSWDVELADYRRWCVSGGTAAATIKLRMYYLDRFAAHHDDNPYTVKIGDLTAFLSEADWAPETRKSARAALRSFYRWAADVERINADPSRKLPTVRVPSGKPKPAPENTVAAALARATPPQRLMVMLAAFAGLRCCEIARVHTSDVQDGVLRVHGKGGKERLVPLHPAIVAKLPTDPGWVFLSPLGGHLRPNSVSVILKGVLGPGFSAHMLRHRFATQAYAHTHDLRAVQELLGHSKPETTMRYTLVDDDSLRAAVMAAYVA